ncbi:uncharacterized protein N7525_001461, partial [Penicillium rubens]|uniref:uncharacterized protein n=1 Tax=Penicillium rubens TaxID=1108849 RepID=UPI002A5AA1AF
SKYNNVISFSLKILFRVPAHYSKDRLWRPTAFDDISCSLAMFVALPNVDALGPQPPCSASLLCLKILLGRLRSDLLR